MEEIIKVYFCNACKRWTKHSLLFTYTFEQLAGDTTFYKYINIWYCRGCEDVLYETIFSNSDELDENGNLILHPLIYPYRTIMTIAPKRFLTLPHNLNLLYFEIVSSINHNILILAAIGLRTLLEGICKDKSIPGKNLKELIDNINFINDNIKTNLHGFRFMGNDAAHELDCPTREEIALALEVMEDLMNYTYDLDYKSSRILEIVNQKHSNKNTSLISTEKEETNII
jgi:hypothetical protein